MPGAADIAAALRLRPAGCGCWRGACPICGGSRRFQVRQGRTAPLVWCFAGCRPEDLLAELRRRGLRESREWTPEQRREWAEEKRRREEAERFARAGVLLCDAALERMPSNDARRADLATLQTRLLADPVGEAAWWQQNRPRMFRALVHAGARQERGWRRRAARLLEVL